MAFDPATGNLIDADFVPFNEAANLGTPIAMIPSPGQDALLLSDQLRHVINEYDLEGNWQGVFAPAGGPDTSILQNIRGIHVSPEGTVLSTVAAGGNAQAVAEFDAEGNFLGNYIENGAGGLNSPWSLVFRDGDVLVSASGSSAIHRFNPDGTPTGELFFGPIGFPQQMQELPNGNILVAQFTTVGGMSPGVWELTAAGELVDIHTGVGGNRGVFELPNGNILTTNAGGVHEIDRSDNLVETKISGVGARFITHVQLDASACAAPGDVPWLSVSPTSGSTAPGGSSDVSVSFDSSGLELGEHTALLCVASNDPATPLVEVPVSLTVVEAQDPGPVVCDETIIGVHEGPLTIAEGTTCLAAGAHVLGEVNVLSGAGLVSTAAVVQGPVSAVGAAVVDLAFTQVTGPVLVSGVTESVSLFANQVTGSVSLVGNSTGGTAITVAGNTVIGSLSCFGNDPAPTHHGLPNTATAGKLGQCAAL
jgi:hypothetical protein